MTARRRRPSLPLVPCITCGAKIRRARPEWAFCSGCMRLAEAAFSGRHSPADPDAWIRERNRFFTDRELVLATILAERAAMARAA